MAAPTTELSDEDWLIMRAKNCMNIDKYAAKAWMITAQSMFPQNFSIQFESYVLEKQGGNKKEAAKMLETMYTVFGQEARLLDEVKLILDVMQSESKDPGTQIYTDMFAELPTTTQCEMLLTVADSIHDHLDQCRLLLLAMKRFSSLVNEQGLKLVEKLLWSERQASLNTPVNSYRKLLVCDVIPLVLTKCQSQLTSKQLYKWLQKCMEFYVSYTATPITGSDNSDTDLTPSRELFSPTSKKAKRHPSISGLSDSQSTVNSPWTSMYKVLQSIGEVLKWEMDPEFFNKPVDYQWVQIQNLYNRDKQTDSVLHQKQILFTTVLLFLESLFNYVSAVNPAIFSHDIEMMFHCESSKNEKCFRPQIKKPRADVSPIVATSEVANSSIVISHLTTAIHCYNLLLSTELLKKDFTKLRQLWQMDSWTWTLTFDIDMLIHNGAYEAAVTVLQKDVTALRLNSQMPSKLQLATCFYKLHRYKACCELLLYIITNLEANRDKKSELNLHPESPHSRSESSLILSQFTCAEILPYCVQLLVALFKEKLKAGQPNDTLIGHMVVLLQSDWPTHEALFSQCIKAILTKGSLRYLLFFDYVINVEMLEEFTFIHSSQGGDVKLDVVTSSQLSSQK